LIHNHIDQRKIIITPLASLAVTINEDGSMKRSFSGPLQQDEQDCDGLSSSRDHLSKPHDDNQPGILKNEKSCTAKFSPAACAAARFLMTTAY
jgi:hypothetical protein